MYPSVVTKDPTAVEVEVQAAYLAMFATGDLLLVPRIFGWAIECFTGGYGDYQAVDARYHDFEHTLQATLYGGQTEQFGAIVANTSNSAVTWTVSPTGSGTINSSGLYTAPASIASQTTVTVTATSLANSFATASATITLSPPVAVNVAQLNL